MTKLGTPGPQRAHRRGADINFAGNCGIPTWKARHHRYAPATRRSTADIKQVGRELVVGYVLEGSVPKIGITAQLIAVEWAQKAVELRPGLLGAHRVLCASLGQGGKSTKRRRQ